MPTRSTSPTLPLLLACLWALPHPARAAEPGPGDLPADGTPAESPAERLVEAIADAAAEPQDPALQALTTERDRLAAENSVREETLRAELADLHAQQQRLEAEHQLQQQQLAAQLAELEAEKNRLDLENALADARRLRETADRRIELENLDLQIQQAEKQLALANRELAAEQARIQAANLLADEKLRASLSDLRAENEKLALENARLRELQARDDIELAREAQQLNLETARLAAQQARHNADLMALQSDLTLREQKERWRSQVSNEIEYAQQAFADGTLRVSDRRIALNGPIISGYADFVTRRIHYFNNQSRTLPIFIVIDRSPGGSVMEGYRILKAMEASEAPIHVVVKSFAASMAAVIASMAEASYAYPNAILLHHQPSGIAWGNVTQQTEQLEMLREWAKRLHEPVARKMGLSLDEFYDRMYKENSEGDWQEFADAAVGLKWIDHVVNEIREEGIRKEPEDEPPKPFFFFFAKGESPPENSACVTLPRLEPFDFYFLYNPEGFYRVQQ